MGESNGDYGQLASVDSDLAAAWDQCKPIPEPGENVAFDGFVADKRGTHGGFVRIGARMRDDFWLAYATSHGLKFRNITSGRRENYIGSEFPTMRLVRGSDSSIALIAAGETDAVRLSDAYPYDVFILPAGEMYFPDTYAAQVAGYPRVLAAHDNDEAGEKGWTKVKALVPQAERFRAPANDFCSSPDPLPPIPPAPERDPAAEFLVSGGDLLSLEIPERESFFDNALLPVGGQLILHGWAKSFKTFAGLDLMAAIAQSTSWCGFEPTGAPAKVAIIQFEIVWPFYGDRYRAIRARATHPDLLDENFMTVTPLRRPPLMAGDTKLEDAMIANLVDAGVEVVMIDPIRRALGSVNINATEDIRPILAFAERLRDNSITTVLTHHDSKAGARAGGGSPLSMTGAGDFAGDADSIVSVAIPQGMKLEDPFRNVYFTLRNGPSPSARGMSMVDGHLEYQDEPFGDGMDEGDAPRGPSI